MNENAPLVSVIIPTYNHAEFIREALKSLCAQTFLNWEAIVVNNYSEDETISVVESFCDPRIRLENFRNHGVIAASRNYAASLAQGDFLAFLDSDDTWLPEKLERCVECLGDDVDLVGHGMRTFGNGVEREFFSGPEDRFSFESLLYHGNCLTPSALIVRKDVVVKVGGFTEVPVKVTAEDYDLWIKLSQAGIRARFIREVLGMYRIHSMNQSGSITRNLDATLAVLEDFFPDFSERTLLDRIKIRRRLGVAFYGAGRGAQKAGAYHEAWRFFLRAWLTWPIYLKTYISMILNIFFGLLK